MGRKDGILGQDTPFGRKDRHAPNAPPKAFQPFLRAIAIKCGAKRYENTFR
jgi:hypothetical protein